MILAGDAFHDPEVAARTGLSYTALPTAALRFSSVIPATGTCRADG
ncbi:hypothetical protein ABZ570_01260 [Micromonospora sp. NPDC007271]